MYIDTNNNYAHKGHIYVIYVYVYRMYVFMQKVPRRNVYLYFIHQQQSAGIQNSETAIRLCVRPIIPFSSDGSLVQYIYIYLCLI